jgi:hypothetical protein
MYFPGTADQKQGIFLHTPTFVNGTNARASYFIKAQDDGSGTYQFVVYGDGSTGIGTEAVPGYKLSVNGAAIFTKAVVKADIWADYVFDSAYQLASLPTVEQYIKTNHHLPDMPSADSVATAGIDLGRTQAALLKKIEELTLYVIGQQQQLDALKAKDQQREKEQLLLKAQYRRLQEKITTPTK